MHPYATHPLTTNCIFIISGNELFIGSILPYERYAARNDLALITTLILNNAFGLHRLLNEFYPERLPEFEHRFSAPPDIRAKGPTWQSSRIAEWATRHFLDVDAGEILATRGDEGAR